MVRILNRIFKFRGNICNNFFDNTTCQKTLPKEWFWQYRGYVLYPLTGSLNSTKNNKDNNIMNNRLYCNPNPSNITSKSELSTAEFSRISNETLESLSDYFDELIEKAIHLKDADVSYGDGVLTVKFGGEFGTYVINKQTPNKQIWLSSPLSGPKRYDFVNGKWIYKYDKKSLHELLNDEIPKIVKTNVSFLKCSYSGAH